MRRAYICAHAKFPRGGAEANYIYNLAKCLQYIGCNVTIISRGKNREEDWNEEKQEYFYQGIRYLNIDGVVRNYKKYFYEGKQVTDILGQCTFSDVDYIFTYSVNYFYIKKIFQYAKLRNINFCTCSTEYHYLFPDKRRWNDPSFWLERLGFRFGIPINRKVIVISRYLQQYFSKLSCETFILPPLVDFNEYEKRNSGRFQSEVCNIIYSGNPSGKDDMNIMLQSVLMVSRKSRRKIKFHITGCTKEKIMKITSLSDYEWQDLREVVCFYSWMEYDELIDLYQNMDFFLLARHKNKITLANFPSKVPELMTYGIIPIVSKVGDYTELYIEDGKNGIIFPNCTVAECTEAIRRGMFLPRKDKELLSYNAQQLVKDRFDYHTWGEKIKAFLH